MPQADFYNVNEHRIYPFTPGSDLSLSGGFSLTNRHLLDCGFTIGINSQYNTGFKPVVTGPPHTIHTIKLSSVTRTTATTIDFVFVADSPSTPSFTFTRDAADARGAISYTDGGTPDIGVAFLVTGDLSALFASGGPNELPIGSVLALVVPPEVEPALVVSLAGHAVTEINVGNLPRIRAEDCPSCGSPPLISSEEIKVVALDLDGGIVLKQGYNVSIKVDVDTNTILISAIVGAGLGVTCEEIERFPGEASALPPGELLSGGPKCSGLIYTINGVAPSASGEFTIRGSNGISTTQNQAGFELIVNADVSNVAACE